MTDRSLKDARTKAEAAVADMPAGELRTAAFSVILTHLLSSERTEASLDGIPDQKTPARAQRKGASKGEKPASSSDKGLTGRLLGLREESFFEDQRSLAEVRDELKKRGWHYPLTSLSGPMQRLVRGRELRREQVSGGKGKKKVWKYSNR